MKFCEPRHAGGYIRWVLVQVPINPVSSDSHVAHITRCSGIVRVGLKVGMKSGTPECKPYCSYFK
jgi:hypothetical protein